MIGVYGRSYHQATGTVTNAISLFADHIDNNGVGTITNAIGLYVYRPNTGTNNYGIYFNGAPTTGSLGATNDTDITVTTAGTGGFKTNQVFTAATASACQSTMSGGAGAGFFQAANGTNCAARFNAQGTGVPTIGNGNGNGFSVSVPASVINSVQVNASVTGSDPSLAAVGDTNRNLNLQGAGTGIATLGNLSAVSATAGAATCNAQRCIVTSEAITTAAGADYVLTMTDNKISTSSIILATVANGTNTTEGIAVNRVQPGSGSAVIHVRNTHASAALNGTIVVNAAVMN
jgi:hypothetical protein